MCITCWLPRAHRASSSISRKSLQENQIKMLRMEQFHHRLCKAKTLLVVSFLCSSGVLFQVGLDGKATLNPESYFQFPQSMGDAGISVRFLQLLAQNQACDTLKMFRSWQCNSCPFYCMFLKQEISLLQLDREKLLPYPVIQSVP